MFMLLGRRIHVSPKVLPTMSDPPKNRISSSLEKERCLVLIAAKSRAGGSLRELSLTKISKFVYSLQITFVDDLTLDQDNYP